MARFVFAIALATTFAALACLGGCSEDASPRPAPRPIRGQMVAQEIWVTYHSPEHNQYGRRTGRGRDEARKLAESLHQRVLDGEDIGKLALDHSNAPGGCAEGFSGALPGNAHAPTERDRAVANVRIGQVTPILDWLGGYWFAKRVDLARGSELQALFERFRLLRVKFRAIAILYREAYIPDSLAKEKVKRSRAQAVKFSETLLERLAEGEKFADLARRYSEDGPSGARGGLQHAKISKDEETEWIWRTYDWIPDSVLDAAFSTEVGKVHPEVIVSTRGVFLVKVEARRNLEE